MPLSNCSNNISEYFSIGINGIFHVLILFTFLTILFFTLVSVLEKKAFDTEIEEQIDNSMDGMFSSLTPEDKYIISEVINTDVGGGKSPIDVAIEKYSTPSEVVVEHNKWVKISAITIILIILLIVVLIVSVLYFSCGKKTGVVDIATENVITFAFVGLVEYLFFTHIAFKYIPAPPSTMVTSLITTFKEMFV